MTREEYLARRRCYEPEQVKLAIIGESPPASDLYFYKPDGRTTESLFFALMKQLPYSPRRKDDGLKEFQQRGWVLVDATYRPVNKRKDRDRVIEEDYECLCRDLSSLFKGRAAPIILIKVNVCRILRPKLLKDGFNVLNKDNDDIPFPSHSHQIKFGEMFGTLLKLHGLEA
jgi:hypothetical protein